MRLLQIFPGRFVEYALEQHILVVFVILAGVAGAVGGVSLIIYD